MAGRDTTASRKSSGRWREEHGDVIRESVVW